MENLDRYVGKLLDRRYRIRRVIGVGGMMCGHCTAAVEKACLSVTGVESAIANLEANNVTVVGNFDVEAVKKAIRNEDYEILEG